MKLAETRGHATVYTVAPHMSSVDVTPKGPQSTCVHFLSRHVDARISVMFMLRPALPASFLAKIGAAGYTASAARWSMSLALRDGRAASFSRG